MKKVILFLSVFMLSLTGLLFGCSKDKYEDLRITVTSVVNSSTGQPLNYNSDENYYEVYVGDSFTISCGVTCSTPISSYLNFTSENNEILSRESLTNYGKTATYNVLESSTENLTKITISSMETNKNSINLYFKVIMPVSQIAALDNLLFTYDRPLNIKDNINFYSGNSGYEVSQNEKNVTYSLNTFVDNKGFEYYIVEGEDGWYNIQGNNNTNGHYVNGFENAFRIVDDVLYASDGVYGKINLEVKSYRHVENIEDTFTDDMTDSEKTEIITKNDKLKDDMQVKVFEPLTIEDFSFSSGQISFANVGGDNENVKLNSNLYLNTSTQTYNVSNTKYNYNTEKFELSLNTTESYYVVLIDENGNEITTSTDDVVRLTSDLYVISPSQNASFTLVANKNGAVYIDFVIKFAVDNDLTYSFSELYQDYLDENSQQVDLNRIKINVNSLSDGINVYREDILLDSSDDIVVYDKYPQNMYGTKFQLELAKLSGVLDQNKKVKVYIESEVAVNINDYFEFSNQDGVKITLQTELNENNQTVYYFVCDLTRNSESIFFVKALKIDETNLISFKFENLIESTITTSNGVVISANDTQNTNLTTIKNIYGVSVEKGVSLLEAKVIANSNYYNVASNKDSQGDEFEEFYNKLVLNLNDYATLLATMYDFGLSAELEFSYDSSVISIEDVTNNASSFYGADSDLTNLLSIEKVYAIKGIKEAKGSKITITADNGYSIDVYVDVVKEATLLSSSLDYSNDVVTSSNLSSSSPYAYAKINSSFNYLFSATNLQNVSTMSGILGYNYSSNNELVALISDDGKVTTISEGNAKISLDIEYYEFNLINGYNQWTKRTDSMSFDLTTFIPATNISVNIGNSMVVYNYDDLPFNDKTGSNVSISVVIEGDNPTIAREEFSDRITFTFDENYLVASGLTSGNVSYGKDFNAVAQLSKNEEYAIVPVTIIVNEFGISYPFNCQVRITKPIKVEEIDLKITDSNGEQVTIEKSSNEDEISIRVRDGERLNIQTIINPEQPYINTFVASIDKNGYFNDNAELMGLDFNGNDRFVLNILDGENSDGYLYLTISAKDSAFTEIDDQIIYTKTLTLKIIIEDGVKHSYSISNADELMAISVEPSKNYEIVNDIYLVENWTPIANFTGILNGNGYTIYGLQIGLGSSGLLDTNTNYNVGLFASIDNNDETGNHGVIYNLKLQVENINIVSENTFDNTVNIGTFAGVNNGVILNSSVVIKNMSVNLSGTDVNVGGVVGLNNGGVINFGIDFADYENDNEKYTRYFNRNSGSINNYIDGTVPTDSTIELAVDDNYVKGSIFVSDGVEHSAFVGGIAGNNAKSINGFYGVYSKLTNNSKNFIVSYQNQYVDVDVKINTSNGSLINQNSAVGGVAGYNSGYVTNISAQGQIGSYSNQGNQDNFTIKYNVGGIVGYSFSHINNVLSNVFVRGYENVGGIVGKAEGTYENTSQLTNLKVEAYFDNSYNSNTLIIASNNAGGIAGNSNYIRILNSYFYGYSDKFDSDYVSNGDIYVVGLNAVAGGLVGNAVNSNYTEIVSSFAICNLVAKSQSDSVKGLVGSSAKIGSESDIFYIGYVNIFDKTLLTDILGIERCDYYYVFNYNDEQNSFVVNKTGGDLSKDANPNIIFEYSNELGVTETVQKYSSLLRQIPTMIEMVGKGENATNQNGEFRLQFKAGNTVNNLFKFQLQQGQETINTLLVLLDETGKSVKINDLFTINYEPASLTSLNVFVSSGDSSIISINEDGTITFNKLGEVTLTFRVRENLLVQSQVKVIVLESFEELQVSPNVNFTTSYFDSKDNNIQKVRTDFEFNLLSQLVRYFGESAYEIDNKSFYKIDYSVFYSQDKNGEYLLAEESLYQITGNDLNSNKIIKFNTTGFFKFIVSVTFTDMSGNLYRFEDNSWEFYLESYNGANDISFATPEISLETSGTYENLIVSLGVDNNVERPKLVLDLQLPNDGGTINLASQDVDAEKGIYLYTNEKSPFVITVTPMEYFGNNKYDYSLNIAVKESFEKIDALNEYILIAYDSARLLENDYADVKINLVPASLQSANIVHYAYTQKASTLINSTNTSINEDNETTYFYSYTKNASDTIFAGMGGLMVIELIPSYSKILSVNISSSLNGSGSDLSFVQLAKVKERNNQNNEYYVVGPAPIRNLDGSYSLNLFSSMPNSYIEFDSMGKASLTGDGKFAFLEEANYPDTSMLFVRTVAPSSLSENGEVTITVKVTYLTVDGNNEPTQKEVVTTKKLVVNDVPGMSLSYSHEGTERKVIAYTGSGEEDATEKDYLDITANIEGGFEGTLVYNYIRGEENKGQDTNLVRISSTGTNKYRLELGPDAQIGDKIQIYLSVKIDYGDRTVVQTTSIDTITIVNVVIKSISLYGLNENSELNMNVSSAFQLKAKIDGYGLMSEISKVEQNISRSVFANNGNAFFWYGQNSNNEVYYVLNSLDLQNTLPFTVNQLPTSNEGAQSITIDNNNTIGLINYTNPYTFELRYDTIYLEGLINSGSANLLLSCSYVYKDGSILLVPNGQVETMFRTEIYFTVNIVEGEGDKNLVAIETEQDFKTKMFEGGDYILMNDITLTNYQPIDANFASFDGNNKVITINDFSYSVAQTGNEKSINLGLFNNVSANSIIKNVIVAFPDDKLSYMDLSTYSTVNFGGIAVVNKGLITNSEVIAIDKDGDDSSIGYTLNIKTSKMAKVNVGLFVNENNGIITNSRVGREQVTILKSIQNGSSLVDETNLENVLKTFAINVYGAGNVGGFVVNNKGTISSSYAKNLQLEVFVDDGSVSLIRTAGFAVENSGYIYGSYSAGFEEDLSSAIVNGALSDSRKLGGGIFTNGTSSGFVYINSNYIEDCYSNINISGAYNFAAKTKRFEDSSLVNVDEDDAFINVAGGSGFVYIAQENSYITTSYSLSKIKAHNTFGPFESTVNSPLGNEGVLLGTVVDCYILKELDEIYTVSQSERAVVLYDKTTVDVEGADLSMGLNQFADENSFNNFSFDPTIEDFSSFVGESSGGVWAIKKNLNNSGYPELISANTISISARVLNVVKSDNDALNKKYYTYVDGYEYGSSNNPYLISNATQYNNIFKDYDNDDAFNESVASKFTNSIRLINHINFINTQINSTSVEYTSLAGRETSIFDGNYLAMYNILLNDSNENKDAFGLFRSVYNAGIKNLSLGVSGINAGNSTTVGALAGIIVDSNISNIFLFACSTTTGVQGEVLGNNYVGALAGIIISSSSTDFHFVSRIKSNLLIKGSSGGGVSSIKTSFDIWDDIKPVSVTSGSSYLNGNLRLNKLNTLVYYAGGIAGVIDLHQNSSGVGSVIISDANVLNVQVGAFKENSSVNNNSSSSNAVEIISDYVGGLFGLVGEETFVTKSQFIVSQDSSLLAKEIAGGIAGVNYGMISKSYVSYDEETMEDIDNNIINYSNGSGYVTQPNSSLFSKNVNLYQPKYIGGIVGLNAGDDTNGSGSILDCYNRVDVKNPYSLGVGGIVGASYIGEISNVYSTASLYGNFELRNRTVVEGGNTITQTITKDDVFVGSIIGKILDDPEGYFTPSNNVNNKELNLSNIVAVNSWDSNDYNAIYTFIDEKGGKIGAIYVYYNNNKSDGELGIVRIDQGSNIYAQNYILNGFDNSYLQNVSINDTFDISSYNLAELEGDITCIELWGTASSGKNYDEYLNSYFSSQAEYKIEPQDTKAFFGDISSKDASVLRSLYFNKLNWLPTTWNYDVSKILPLLEYGYESSIVKIYTASQFFTELSAKDNGDKTFIVMNDIDFSGYNITPILQEFSGILIGNDITYELDGQIYVRNPILFNINLNNDNVEDNSYAIFASSVNATFADLNFVVSSYDVKFTNDDNINQASILVANAESSNFRNINIYDSLLDEVIRESSSISFTSNIGGKYFVTSGLHYNDSNIVNSFSSKPFLVLADESGQNYNYEYTSGNKFDLVYPLVTQGSFKEEITIVEDVVLNTNASNFGTIAGNVTGEINIENCSSSVNVNITYDKTKGTVYVGSLIARGSGKIINSATYSMIYVNSTVTLAETNQRDLETIFVGGIAGNFQGELENVYSFDALIQLGSKDRQLVVSKNPIKGNADDVGVFVGGVVGKLGSYETAGSSPVGGAERIYVEDITISIQVDGHAVVGGVIGKNQAQLEDVYLRQSNIGDNETISFADSVSYEQINKNNINAYLNQKSGRFIFGGIVGEATSSAKYSSIYSNLSINIDVENYDLLYVGGIIGYLSSEGTFEDIVTDAKSISVQRTLDDGLANKLYMGGIVGSASQGISLVQVV